MKLECGRHRDTTKVKGLSPEIEYYVGSRYCFNSRRQNFYNRKGEDVEVQRGLRPCQDVKELI